MTAETFTAAEKAAVAAFGTLADPRELDRLMAAIAAYRHTIKVGGLLRDEEGPPTEEDVEVAAKFLAGEAAPAAPRYSGDGWQILLASAGDVDLAYSHAAGRCVPGDGGVALDLAYARRLLLTMITARETAPTSGDLR